MFIDEWCLLEPLKISIFELKKHILFYHVCRKYFENVSPSIYYTCIKIGNFSFLILSGVIYGND